MAEMAQPTVDTVTRNMAMSVNAAFGIISVFGRTKNEELSKTELLNEITGRGIKLTTLEIENQDVKRFEEAALKKDVVVSSYKFATDKDRNVISYAFDEKDMDKVKDILHELGLEPDPERGIEKVNPTSREDFILTDGMADSLFGKDGGHYITKVEGLSLVERYALQRELADNQIYSHATVNRTTGEFTIEVLDTNKDKLEHALAKTELNLAVFPKQYERSYEHFSKINSILREPERNAGMVIFDSKNPSKSIEFLKDGIKIYDDYGKTQIGNFSYRKEDINKDILDTVYSYAAADYMTKEEYDKTEDVTRYHQYEAEEMNELAFVLDKMDRYHEKHIQEERRAEEKMSINVDGHPVLYFNAEQTVGDFFSKEVREDIKDVSYDVKLSELDDIINDRISALEISTEMYVIQDPDRETEIVPEIGDLVPDIADNANQNRADREEEYDDPEYGDDDYENPWGDE